jgi:hypothetical protein
MRAREEIDSVSASVDTAGKARLVLRECGERLLAAMPSGGDLSANISEAAASIIENSVNYCLRILHELPVDDDAPLDYQTQRRITLALRNAANSIDVVADASKDPGYSAAFIDALRDILSGAISAVSPALFSLWPVWVTLGVVVAIVLWVRR